MPVARPPSLCRGAQREPLRGACGVSCNASTLRALRASAPNVVGRCTDARRVRQRVPKPRAAASPSDDASGNTSSALRSLDAILGSKDDEDDLHEAAAPVPAPTAKLESSSDGMSSGQGDLQPITAATSVEQLTAPAREPPIICYALYYTALIMYASYFAVDLLQGEEAAEQLLQRVVNDHAAAAHGDVLRLLTSGFVTTSPQQLGVLLLAQLTIAEELEAVMGHGTFWAIYSLAIMSGSLADAALSQQPITQGPSAAVAGMVGALLAHLVRNWRLEAQLAELKQRRHKARGAGGAGAGAAWVQRLAPPPPPPSAGGTASPPQQQQQQQGEAQQLEEAELPLPLGLELRLLVPTDAKGFISLGATAVAAIDSLFTVLHSDEAGAAADWWGLIGGFIAGGLLGAALGPSYALVPRDAVPGAAQQLQEAGGADGGAAAQGLAAAAAHEGAASGGGGGYEGPMGIGSGVGRVVTEVEGGLVLVDETTNVQRALVTVGCSAGLCALLSLWLLQQGG